MVAKIIISPELDKRGGQIESILSGFNLNLTHSDVLFISKDEKLGIEAARKIKEHFSYKPIQGKNKAVVLEDGEGLTIEAQNALLKTIEELPEHGIFLIGASNINGFLPTVLSRCQVSVIPANAGIQLKTSGSEMDPRLRGDDKHANDINSLLKADIKERFLFIEQLKDKEEFLNALLHCFREKLLQGDSSKQTQEFIDKLLEAEKWANQNVNIRGILEYLMLNLPLQGS